MKKKQRNSEIQLINMIFILVGLATIFSMHLSFYYLFAIVILSIIISQSLRLLLSVKDTNKKRSTQTTTFNLYNVKHFEEILTYDLQDLSESDFKELCFQYFKNTYRQVEKTPISKDCDVDFIFVNKEGLRMAVQVKHKMQSEEYVTSNEMNSLIEAKRNYNCMRAMVISSTGYTEDASVTAAEHNIEIYSHQWIENKVLRWREKEEQKSKIA